MDNNECIALYEERFNSASGDERRGLGRLVRRVLQAKSNAAAARILMRDGWESPLEGALRLRARSNDEAEIAWASREDWMEFFAKTPRLQFKWINTGPAGADEIAWGQLTNGCVVVLSVVSNSDGTSNEFVIATEDYSDDGNASASKPGVLSDKELAVVRRGFAALLARKLAIAARAARVRRTT